MNYWKDKEKRISKSDVNIYPAGTKTTDWEWRTNLKKWDLVDCYDRSKWYPATIMDIKEEGEIEGIKFINYQIGWRLYPEHYNNLEDPEDKPEKHLDLWTTNKDIETDSKGEKFFGDREIYLGYLFSGIYTITFPCITYPLYRRYTPPSFLYALI